MCATNSSEAKANWIFEKVQEICKYSRNNAGISEKIIELFSGMNAHLQLCIYICIILCFYNLLPFLEL